MHIVALIESIILVGVAGDSNQSQPEDSRLGLHKQNHKESRSRYYHRGRQHFLDAVFAKTAGFWS